MPQNLANRRRASRPKTRTGCITCKYASSGAVTRYLAARGRKGARQTVFFGLVADRTIIRKRRVKCDESKPCCKRCVNFRVNCEGYDDLNWKLLPAKRANFMYLTSVTKEGPSTGIGFQNEHEWQYFRLFQHEISSKLSCGFDVPFWNRQVLQACTSAPVLQLTTGKQFSKPPFSFEIESLRTVTLSKISRNH